LGISAGYDVPYQLVSGDYTGINDRLWRAVMNQYHRELKQQQNLFINKVCRKIWSEFVNRAILSQAITRPIEANNFNYLRCKHRTDAWDYIHPLQDIQAQALEVEKGFSSRQKIVDERSSDTIEEIDNQRANDALRESTLNLNKMDKENV
jgi:capsid protein